ncbi:MAG: universal stress protein [Caldilineaceae bacterium]|nr:universal stress protein [Caldilineaceae bacterium]MCB0121738.1 universal stress protein [Caldilineaceae bacterium]
MRKNRVLIPIDGSDFSRQILAQVPHFLDSTMNQLILYQVVEEPRPVHIHDSGVDIDIYVDQIENSMQMQMADNLRVDLEQLREAGFEVTAMLDFGERPARNIETVVEENDIDMIAMTTHGRSGLRRIFAGSVAEHVLHHVDVPILLLRPKEALSHDGQQLKVDGKDVEPMLLV